MADLKGQVALVTGASRGLGRAMALELAAQGATVVGTATTDAGAGEIQKAFDAAGVTGWGAAANVTEAAACEALIAEIEKKFGPVSVLVNNIVGSGIIPRAASGRVTTRATFHSDIPTTRAACSTRGSTLLIAARAARITNGNAETVAATTAPDCVNTNGAPKSDSHVRPRVERVPSSVSK